MIKKRQPFSKNRNDDDIDTGDVTLPAGVSNNKKCSKNP